MPRGLMVVEGITDAIFFSELLSVYLTNYRVEPMSQPGRENIPEKVEGFLPDGSKVEVEFRYQMGSTKIPEIIGTLIREEITPFTVIQDLNEHSPEELIQSIKDIASGVLGISAGEIENILPSGEKFRVRKVTISVIPMGLYHDPDLRELGITSHAMEDYLIKLLLLDESLTALPQFRSLLQDLLETIRSRVSFHTSKELFQLAKPLIKKGFSDTGVVQALYSKASRPILESLTSDLFEQLIRVLDL